MFDRIALISLILLGSAFSLSCEQNKLQIPDGPPRIHFTTVEQDLGEIPIAPEGRDILFSFVNRGLSDLRVSRLVSSCGCAGADLNNSVLAPGETGIVVVRIASLQSENRTASVTVHSNDPSRPRIPLKVSWRSVAPLEFHPLSLDFGSIRPNETSEKVVKLIRRDGAKNSCQVNHVRCYPEEYLGVTVQSPNADTGRKNTTFLVSLTASSAGGIQSGRIDVLLEDCWRESLSIPVRWNVQDVIETKPGRLFLGAGVAGETKTRKVIICTLPGEFLEINEMDSHETIPEMSVYLERLESNRILADVRWTLPESAGQHTGEIVFHCKQPKQQTLSVPVSVYVFQKRGNPMQDMKK